MVLFVRKHGGKRVRGQHEAIMSQDSDLLTQTAQTGEPLRKPQGDVFKESLWKNNGSALN